MTERLLLIGGPRHGEIVEWHSGPPPFIYRVPVFSDYFDPFSDGSPTEASIMHVGIYGSRLHVGHVSRDDNGCLIYEWKGVR